MRPPVLRVALTGGIATGKSTCLRRFAELGARTIDADVIAREVVLPGRPALAAIVSRFGTGILGPDGTVDRSALGRVVFHDAEARADLERIIHPEVFAAIERWFEELVAHTPESTPIVAIADIPLLYETDQAHRFDWVIVSACDRPQQLERLMARNGLSREEAQTRIDAQLSIDEKRARADLVVDTSGTMAETIESIDMAWSRLAG
jgi:dephospho-CoA kinase